MALLAQSRLVQMTVAMRVKIKVPIEAASIEEALKNARSSQADEVVIHLEPNFEEPREAWPLELESGVGSGSFRVVEVCGPASRAATVCDVDLRARGPRGEGPSVALRSVVVRGCATLSGAGCLLEDCEVRHGVEVSAAGAAGVRHCTVRSNRLGISVRGPVPLESNFIENCSIGICLYDNAAATLKDNELSGNSVGGVVLHGSMAADVGSELRLAVGMEDDDAVEVNVEVDGASPLSFQGWPLLAGSQRTPRLRGGYVEVEVVDASTLRVVGFDAPPPRTKRRKRSRQEAAAPVAGSETLSAVAGPPWALDVLGLSDASTTLTLGQVRRAYRLKAREVHPDKQPSGDTLRQPGNNTREGAVDEDEKHDEEDEEIVEPRPPLTGAVAGRFHEVTAAYEALLDSLRASSGPLLRKSKPVPTGHRRRRAQGSVS